MAGGDPFGLVSGLKNYNNIVIRVAITGQLTSARDASLG